MRKIKANKFTFNGFECVKIGTVEMTVNELIDFHQKGKYWILARECAYMTHIEDDGNGGIDVSYSRVRTTSQNNTLPHRYFVMDWDRVKGYIAHEFKVWSVEFDTIAEAQEEEYNARHDGDMNTVITGGLNGFKANLLIESEGMSDKMIPQWFPGRAELRFMDQADTRKLFHPYPRTL